MNSSWGGARYLTMARRLLESGRLPGLLRAVWEELHCPYLLCEGGGHLALSLLEAGLVDDFRLHLAPLILGDEDALPLFSGRAPLSLEEALRMRVSNTHLCGSDIHIHLRPLEAAKA